MTPIRITYFSDVLCVWAYVAERRLSELHREFGEQLAIESRFVSIFGHGRVRLTEQWREKGGLRAYATHARGVVAGFDHVTMHADAWEKVAPASSWPAHAWLASIRALEAEAHFPRGSCDRAAWRVREAFFVEARDVAREETLAELTLELGLDPSPIERFARTGEAWAALSQDLELARDRDVRMSPTLLMNEGRQRLAGNVGYRALAANVRELIERPTAGFSWC